MFRIPEDLVELLDEDDRKLLLKIDYEAMRWMAVWLAHAQGFLKDTPLHARCLAQGVPLAAWNAQNQTTGAIYQFVAVMN